MLTSAASCREYILNHTPEELAIHLLEDQKLCKAGRLPSILALYLPYQSPLADAIAGRLAYTYRKDIQRLQYRGILRGIKAFLSEFEPGKKEEGETDTNLPSPRALGVPTTQEFETAIKVLEYLEKVPATNVTEHTPLEDIFTAINLHVALDPTLRVAYNSLPGNPALGESIRKQRGGIGNQFKKCYMCNYLLTNPHSYYKSLCVPCGSFNLQESTLSLPGNLNLSHKTALVTGGRVNLGFHIALRLLRCGAHVIVSSRYPLDAETRYRAQPSFQDWKSRIRVVGADFRTAKDAFALVTAAKGILVEWAQEGTTDERLDILVNNAAQTLTDSVKKEKVAVGRECELQNDLGVGALQVTSGQGYQAMVRVGGKETQMFIGLPAADEQVNSDDGDTVELEPGPSARTAPGQTQSISTLAVRQESSWTQSINQIPYEDVITAQAVNAFVPLILIRELIPLMGSLRTDAQPSADTTDPVSGKPLGYIINISSREGLSEALPTASIKNGFHVHTNMSKAALNMLTETEAAPAWRERKVAMNSVDPGFMSAADGSACPIGWEDGAARALWCVAKGETERMSVWGRFLKHFGGVGVVVRQL